MEQWVEKLKKMPRWAWWAGGGAVLLVILLALRARRTSAPAAVQEVQATPEPSGPDFGPPSAAPAGGAAPDPEGGAESWWRSAAGGFTNRIGQLELQVAQIRVGQATERGWGMGTLPNRGTIAAGATPFTVARQLAEEDALTEEASAALGRMLAAGNWSSGGTVTYGGKTYGSAQDLIEEQKQLSQAATIGYAVDSITGEKYFPGQAREEAVGKADYGKYAIYTYKRPDGSTYTKRVDAAAAS